MNGRTNLFENIHNFHEEIHSKNLRIVEHALTDGTRSKFELTSNSKSTDRSCFESRLHVPNYLKSPLQLFDKSYLLVCFYWKRYKSTLLHLTANTMIVNVNKAVRDVFSNERICKKIPKSCHLPINIIIHINVHTVNFPAIYIMCLEITYQYVMSVDNYWFFSMKICKIHLRSLQRNCSFLLYRLTCRKIFKFAVGWNT